MKVSDSLLAEAQKIVDSKIEVLVNFEPSCGCGCGYGCGGTVGMD